MLLQLKMWAIVRSRFLWDLWCTHLLKKYQMHDTTPEELWNEHNTFDGKLIRTEWRLTPFQCINAKLYEEMVAEAVEELTPIPESAGP